jgi:hypothetical protein
MIYCPAYLILMGPYHDTVIKVAVTDLCNYNLPERDEFVTMVIKIMIKFNKDVVIRPIVFVPGHFFNSEHGPYLFLVFSFERYRSMHCGLLCNQLYRTPEILK